MSKQDDLLEGEMSEVSEPADIYAAVEETAQLLDVPCSRDKVQPALAAFGDGLADGHIVFSMATGERYKGELAFDFTVPTAAGDPYAIALSNGLVEETDHPIRTLFSDVRGRCPVDSYGVDYGIVGGFKKTYVSFPLGELQGLSRLTGIPSMPRALAEHAGFFASHGLDDRVSAIAIDYAHRTWNVYFSGLPAEFIEPETVLSVLRTFGLPEPSERMMEFIRTSFAMYTTFGWDSSKAERICFSARSSDPTALPARYEPQIAKFARNAPYTYTGERVLTYAGALSPSEEFYKLASFYQKTSKLSDRVRPAT
ncbi:aromatic prenyltransferase [Streptomyces sp. NPDC057424]|uniref:aromatic prenyltransferase n=1 Tax=Streptomyces sp. NPDC057424 TaxID=3346127 RepID=UPI0036736E51